jgi:transcriptional regulator with XRE-family HTH domain
VDDAALGRRFRALRHRLRWRQADVGERAGVSQDLVSLVERGRIEHASVRSLRGVARALGGELRLDLWFRGAELDRLLDEGHAALVGAIVVRLEGLGWECRPEVSFAVYGERGSIDVVAWHAATRTLLVIEVKTELVSVEETLRRHDVKVRLAADVVRKRFGWEAQRVGRLLVLPGESTPRRQVARHAEVMSRAYPLRGVALRRWLQAPSGSVAGLGFVAGTNDGRATRHAVTRKRIRMRPEARPERETGAIPVAHEARSS